jgi:hypothetical protein
MSKQSLNYVLTVQDGTYRIDVDVPDKLNEVYVEPNTTFNRFRDHFMYDFGKKYPQYKKPLS